MKLKTYHFLFIIVLIFFNSSATAEESSQKRNWTYDNHTLKIYDCEFIIPDEFDIVDSFTDENNIGFLTESEDARIVFTLENERHKYTPETLAKIYKENTDYPLLSLFDPSGLSEEIRYASTEMIQTKKQFALICHYIYNYYYEEHIDGILLYNNLYSKSLYIEFINFSKSPSKYNEQFETMINKAIPHTSQERVVLDKHYEWTKEGNTLTICNAQFTIPTIFDVIYEDKSTLDTAAFYPSLEDAYATITITGKPRNGQPIKNLYGTKQYYSKKQELTNVNLPATIEKTEQATTLYYTQEQSNYHINYEAIIYSDQNIYTVNLIYDTIDKSYYDYKNIFLDLVHSIILMDPSSKTDLSVSWLCPSCSNQANGNFCNNCGQPKPAADHLTNKSTPTPEPVITPSAPPTSIPASTTTPRQTQNPELSSGKYGKWYSFGLGKLLPNPSMVFGRPIESDPTLKINTDTRFMELIQQATNEDFERYIAALQTYGFNNNINRIGLIFEADDSDNHHIMVGIVVDEISVHIEKK